MSAPLTIANRVSAILYDCGLEAEIDESIVGKGRRLASYLGSEFVSVLATVEEGELLIYGAHKSQLATVVPYVSHRVLSATGTERSDVSTACSPPGTECSSRSVTKQAVETPAEIRITENRSTKSNEQNGSSLEQQATADKLHLSISNIALVCVLPWLVFCIWGFSYSSIALHYRANGWPIWRLSIIALNGNLLRPIVNALIGQVGAWIAAPLGLIALVSIVPAFIWPDSELMVSIQLFMAYFIYLELALQTVCFSQFAHSKDLLKQASRLQTLGGTTGLAMSPFIGGLVYDFWGWKGCVAMHLIAQGLLTLGFCTGPGFWKDWQKWKQSRSATPKEPSTQVATPVQKREGFITKSVNSAFPVMLIPRSVRWPCLAVAFAVGVNSYSYQCEWSTYALYFREEHNWSSAMWAGICQMSGDMFGAVILTVAARMKSSKGHAEDSNRQTQSGCALFSKPYHIAWLLVAWLVLNLGLTMHSLKIAVASQVLMGTVYVFFMQWSNEMNMLYAFGDSDAYVKLRTMSLFLYTTFTALGAGLALLLYENVGRLSPFYVTAVMCFIVLVFYLMIFLPRAGCGGDLEHIEQEKYEKASLKAIVPAASECTVIQVAPATSDSAPLPPPESSSAGSGTSKALPVHT
eukprot:gnl/MRDRNA2_/MRDRNA2_140182_c0_seq1.p1 gnl/MRDRNA2_/MRDRNA2_140182_c0~~gnl/MRDRNA2_/MRDRNA2_140182_c0_seq1.p1  ORF type:complete len:635 (-),score=74.44 gnl/MRDRNA2_/MRDRNA2_140182_c0_seq1:287-2191(-)